MEIASLTVLFFVSTGDGDNSGDVVKRRKRVRFFDQGGADREGGGGADQI